MPQEEIEASALDARLKRLENVIVDMAKTIKILTEKDDRAQEFVARIEQITRDIRP